ncbi:sensor histidine kinase [Endozoicomonas sp. SM1973]|uniref:C4-dicarboxylate transport sensor protein DctB n=1 Tax=Spartinivicinus marinus TaxID=2994442 RepID=A0A853I627_9GAMM|nr:ATP-binding protein [Spartinivicinus marinus]NYZ67062.1 sensor histidine kinase [Spartinivicinus marinus]
MVYSKSNLCRTVSGALPIGLIIVLLVGLLLSGVIYQLVMHQQLQQLAGVGKSRLVLYNSSIDGVLSKYRHLPYMVAQVSQVKQLLKYPASESLQRWVNDYLYRVEQAASAAAVFILNADGYTIAASNSDTKASFVGNYYGFRPYFKAAQQNLPGQFFAIGVTTGKPGYFYSYPVLSATAKLIGVAVVKVDLEPLQAIWRQADESVMVIDHYGVVVLASNPEWKYRSFKTLSPEVKQEIEEAQLFSNEQIQPLAISTINETQLGRRIKIAANSDDYLLQAMQLPDLNWSLVFLSSTTAAKQYSQLITGLASLFGLFALLAGFVIRQRRLAKELMKKTQDEHLASQQAILREANTKLEERVLERTEKLEAAQTELVQKKKLAALGEMSAAIAHEFNQPLTAIRTYLSSCHLLLKHQRTTELTDNLVQIEQLTGRMANISKQLKTFAYSQPSALVSIDLVSLVYDVLMIFNQQPNQPKVDLQLLPDIHQLPVIGDKTRLEQVISNLISNAASAVIDKVDKNIQLKLKLQGEKVICQVIDNGPGIESDIIEHIFDPFFTTKEVGVGLGLGLSIAYSFIRDLGGTLVASNNPEGGACFTVTLPRGPCVK